MCIIEYKDIWNILEIKGINYESFKLYKKLKPLDNDIHTFRKVTDKILKENHLSPDKDYIILDFNSSEFYIYFADHLIDTCV